MEVNDNESVGERASDVPDPDFLTTSRQEDGAARRWPLYLISGGVLLSLGLLIVRRRSLR